MFSRSLRLSQRDASVDRDPLTCDAPGRIARQESRQVADVVEGLFPCLSSAWDSGSIPRTPPAGPVKDVGV